MFEGSTTTEFFVSIQKILIAIGVILEIQEKIVQQ